MVNLVATGCNTLNQAIFLMFNKLTLQTFFPAMTKIVGTLGPKSRSVDIISDCLKAGMSGIDQLLHLFHYITV